MGQVETGTTTSAQSNKPINFTLGIPAGGKWWQFWEYSVGVDINVNGYGLGINIGTDAGVSYHMGSGNTLDVGINTLGRYYFKPSKDLGMEFLLLLDFL